MPAFRAAATPRCAARTSRTRLSWSPRIAGTGSIECAFEALPLHPRTYEIWASVRGESGFGDLIDWQLVRRFRVVGEEGSGKSATSFALDNSPVKLPYVWRLNAEAAGRSSD